jgi:hypothetical protein
MELELFCNWAVYTASLGFNSEGSLGGNEGTDDHDSARAECAGHCPDRERVRFRSFQGVIWKTGPGGGKRTAWSSPANPGENDLLLSTGGPDAILLFL